MVQKFENLQNKAAYFLFIVFWCVLGTLGDFPPEYPGHITSFILWIPEFL